MISDAVYCSMEQGRVLRIIPDLIRHRGLLADLVSRELRARYRNAMIGFVWAVLQPLLMTLILTFVFTVVFQGGGRGAAPQSAVDILSKLIFWQFLSSGVVAATHSVIENQNLIKKVYFPREAIPIAATINCLTNLLIGFVVLLIVHCVLLGPPSLGVLWILPLFLIQLAMVLGLALFFSAANVFYRDVGYLLEVALTFGFYASPVLYPVEWVEQRLESGSILFTLYSLNPMVGLLTSYREAVAVGNVPCSATILWPALFSVATLLGGAFLFRRLSPTFADHL